ncbi:hypothetical protein NC652_024943 [Populus alba x Populus x berolinensis]|nr:hypothetical protein NC652_024943 [Populus alba x Populus x berolinensis]
MCETGGISETLLPKEADYFFKASLYTIDGGQNDHRTRQGKCSRNVKEEDDFGKHSTVAVRLPAMLFGQASKHR